MEISNEFIQMKMFSIINPFLNRTVTLTKFYDKSSLKILFNLTFFKAFQRLKENTKIDKLLALNENLKKGKSRIDATSWRPTII